MFSVRLCAIGIAVLVSSFVAAESVSTPQILSRTLSAVPSCLQWRWIGNCLWKDCDLLNCSVRTSMKVRHYLPDLLVSVHRNVADDSWVEMRGKTNATSTAALNRVAAQLGLSGAGGHAAVSTDHARNGDLRFFEVNVYDHPLEDISSVVDDLVCQSITQSGKTYYQSVLDAVAWRLGTGMSLFGIASKLGRPIGESTSSAWGSVLPRTGFVIQQSPVRAAAIVAQRACDIVINEASQHVALPLGSPGPYTTVPVDLNERDSATGYWQMVSPKVDRSCDLFGSADPSWDAGRTDTSQSYLWNLWRPYTCCEPRGETYLGSIHF